MEERRTVTFCKNAIAEAKKAALDVGFDELITNRILLAILEKGVCFHIAVKHEEPQVEIQSPFRKSEAILKELGLEPITNEIVHYEPGEELR